MRILPLTISLCLLAGILQAQQTAPLQKGDLGISIAYFGQQVVNPGLKIGAEYCLRSTEKSTISRRGKARVKYRQLLAGLDLGGYRQAATSTNVFLLPGIHYRRTANSGFQYMFGLGAGAMRSFLPSVFEETSPGTVEEIGVAGRSYFAPFVSLGLGKAFRKSNTLENIYLKSQNMLLVGYNTTHMPLFNLELGLTINLR